MQALERAQSRTLLLPEHVPQVCAPRIRFFSCRTGCVDWAALPQRAPPYAPRVEHALDTQNFERFDEEAGPAGGSGGKRWARADPNFIGYTYKNWEAVASPSGARSPPSPRRPYVRRGRRCMPGPLGAGGALGALATLHALC